MCDFSKYGTPSEEWVRLASTLPPVPDLSAEELKNATNQRRDLGAEKMMKQFQLAEKVSSQDYSIPTRDGCHLEARTYRPRGAACDEKLPVYLSLHGGGFLYGTLKSEDPLCSFIGLHLNILVLNLNYRHTPEYPYPTAWNDAEDAMVWLCKNAADINADIERVVIGGSSAGSELSASLTRAITQSELKLSPQPTILGQVLMLPTVVFADCYEPMMGQMKSPSVSSYYQCAEANFMDSKTRKMFNDLLKVENPDPNDKRLNPGYLTTQEAKRMPPTTLLIAGYDPLRDEGLLYGKLLAKNGSVTFPFLVSFCLLPITAQNEEDHAYSKTRGSTLCMKLIRSTDLLSSIFPQGSHQYSCFQGLASWLPHAGRQGIGHSGMG
jgi:acetyl esterase/lipase